MRLVLLLLAMLLSIGAVHAQSLEEIDRVCERLFFAREVRGQETNIKEVERQILNRASDLAGILDLYHQIRCQPLARPGPNPTHSKRLTLLVRLLPRRTRRITGGSDEVSTPSHRLIVRTPAARS